MVKVEPSVFLFIGDENYLKEKALKDLSSSLLDSSSKELDYKIFYGGETDAKEILDYATTVPFLAAKKLIVIKEFEKLAQDSQARLIAYIKRPSKFTCLVLDTTNASVLDDFHSIRRYVNVLRFDELTDSQASTWIKRFLASRDKEIEKDALEILKELQGVNLLSMAQELEKLIAFVGERKVIKTSDVEDLVGKSLVRSVFDLAWAIGEKKTDEALRLASDLILTGKKTHEIVGLLYWHLKRLLRARILQSKGESDYSISNILRINRRNFNEFFKQVRSYDIAQIKSRIHILLEADLDIKTTKLDPTLLLEYAIIRLCLG